MATRLGRAGIAFDGVKAFKGTLEKLAAIAKGEGVSAPVLASKDTDMLKAAGEALQEEARRKGIGPVGRVASAVRGVEDRAAGMVRESLDQNRAPSAVGAVNTSVEDAALKAGVDAPAPKVQIESDAAIGAMRAERAAAERGWSSADLNAADAAEAKLRARGVTDLTKIRDARNDAVATSVTRMPSPMNFRLHHDGATKLYRMIRVLRS